MTSSRRPDNWIVPGGGVEPEEEPSVTAMREVLEEAGVIGKLGRCLGVFEVSIYFVYVPALTLPKGHCSRCKEKFHEIAQFFKNVLFTFISELS